MHQCYTDILGLIPQPPTWFDENAVPRFCKFEPLWKADIYADEVVLAEIACQNCGYRFHVCLSLGDYDRFLRTNKRALADMIGDRSLAYGDPPNIECCAAGPTMSSDLVRVLEYWRRSRSFEWVRYPAMEVVFDEGLANG